MRSALAREVRSTTESAPTSSIRPATAQGRPAGGDGASSADPVRRPTPVPGLLTGPDRTAARPPATSTVAGPLASIRRRPSAAAGPSAVRRSLDNRILAGYSRRRDEVGLIAQAVTAYNNGVRAKSLKDRLAELHALEHSVYDWFSSRHAPDLTQDPVAVRLKELLTAIQEEHEALVAATLRDPQADPPVANFDDLDERNQARVRAVWADLVAGTGNIRITETQSYTSTDPSGGARQREHPGFRIQALTSFARLLSADFGRRLVAEVNQSTGGTNLVTVRPGLATATDDVPAEELVATAGDHEGAALTEFTEASWFGNRQNGSKAWKRRQRELDRLYPLADLEAQQDEATRMSFMHRARPMPIRGGGRTEGFSVMDAGRRRYYRFGGGTTSTITYPSDLRDGSNDPMSRYVDDQGDEIIVPVFIALGHELGHALHTLNGAQSGSAQTLEPIAGAGIDPGRYSGTLEEIVTIRGVENRLRDEHGITARHSHHNVISLACETIRNGPLNQAYNDAARLPPVARRSIEAMLNRVNNLLGARNVREARRALEGARAALDRAQAEAARAAQAQHNAPNAQAGTGFFGSLFSGWPFR